MLLRGMDIIVIQNKRYNLDINEVTGKYRVMIIHAQEKENKVKLNCEIEQQKCKILCSQERIKTNTSVRGSKLSKLGKQKKSLKG